MWQLNFRGTLSKATPLGHTVYVAITRSTPLSFSQVPSNFDSEGVRVMLTDKLSKLISPLGTQDNPAMSCQDIYKCNGDNFKPGRLSANQVGWSLAR